MQVGKYSIDERELQWQFSRSSGPGGQHVNTTDSQVQLTFDLGASHAFPSPLKEWMTSRLGARVRVTVSDHRSQWRNRELARERLVARLSEAMQQPKNRRATRPTRGSQRRRVEAKKQRGETKRLRGRVQE